MNWTKKVSFVAGFQLRSESLIKSPFLVPLALGMPWPWRTADETWPGGGGGVRLVKSTLPHRPSLAASRLAHAHLRQMRTRGSIYE